MSKYNIGIPGPWIKFRSDEVEKQLKEIETVLTAQNPFFYQPFGQPVKRPNKEPVLRPDFAEQVQKQVIALLFALSTNRSELAIKICERLNSAEFFYWDHPYLGFSPHRRFEPIAKQLRILLQSLQSFSMVPNYELHKFLDLLSFEELWGVTL